MKKTALLTTLKNYTSVQLTETPQTAAVLVLLVFDQDEQGFVLLTKRSSSLSHYAGDYCFPGGLREPHEGDYTETILREVFEEIGLNPEHYTLLGQLDDFQDRYGNLVRPFIGYTSRDIIELHYRQADVEIEKIAFLPLAELQNIKTNPANELITRRVPSYYYENQDLILWGLTASILVELENILFKKSRPVSKTILSNEE